MFIYLCVVMTKKKNIYEALLAPAAIPKYRGTRDNVLRTHPAGLGRCRLKVGAGV